MIQKKLENLKVTVIHSKPDVFDRCESEFGIEWGSTVFAVDPYIHCAGDISDDVIEHELVHIKQQREFGGVDKWWEKYFADPQQRLEWELEAYRKQYNVLKGKDDRNRLFRKVVFWSENLSGDGYGHLIEFNEAIKEITK